MIPNDGNVSKVCSRSSGPHEKQEKIEERDKTGNNHNYPETNYGDDKGTHSVASYFIQWEVSNFLIWALAYITCYHATMKHVIS